MDVRVIAWLVPIIVTALIMGVVIWRVRVWSGQGDGLAALILWGGGIGLSAAFWIGWALGVRG